MTAHGVHDLGRVVTYPEGDGIIAQCLDINICAQGSDVGSALARLGFVSEAECTMHEVESIAELWASIGPAPAEFHEMYEAAKNNSATHRADKNEIPTMDRCHAARKTL